MGSSGRAAPMQRPLPPPLSLSLSVCLSRAHLVFLSLLNFALHCAREAALAAIYDCLRIRARHFTICETCVQCRYGTALRALAAGMGPASTMGLQFERQCPICSFIAVAPCSAFVEQTDRNVNKMCMCVFCATLCPRLYKNVHKTGRARHRPPSEWASQ